MEIQEMKELIRECDFSQPYVFISYSSNDKEKVYSDVIELQKRGVNIWIDKAMENRAGEEWQKIAFEAMEEYECKIILFYISINSMCSKPVKEELENRRGKNTMRRNEGKKLPMIPIDVEGIEDITKWVLEDLPKRKIKKNIHDIACDILEVEFENNNNIKRIKRPNSDFEGYYKTIISNLSTYGIEISKKNISSSIEAKQNVNTIKNNELNNKENTFSMINNQTIPQEQIDLKIHSENSTELINDNNGLNVTIVNSVIQKQMSEEKVQDECMPNTVVETFAISVEQEEDKSEFLYFNGAKGENNGLGGITILAGSKISKNESDACPEAVRKSRKESLEKSELKDDGMNYVLMVDKEIKSLSGAACFVCGYSINGKIAWKNSEKIGNRTKGKNLNLNSNTKEISSKINQILKVVDKVQDMEIPITNFTKAISIAATETAEELNIGKSSIIDKCQRQLGLNAESFARLLMNYVNNSDRNLYELVIKHATSDAEKEAINQTFQIDKM